MDQYNFGSDSDTDSDFNGFSPQDIRHADNSTIDNIDSVSEIHLCCQMNLVMKILALMT